MDRDGVVSSIIAAEDREGMLQVICEVAVFEGIHSHIQYNRARMTSEIEQTRLGLHWVWGHSQCQPKLLS